jgi:hypothetical protein
MPLPAEWKSRLRAYLRAKCGEDRDRLSAHDFSTRQSVAIHFPDGSFALFRYAFVVWDEAGHECAVFTEHCGYHVFGVSRAEVEILQSVPDEDSGSE